MTGPKRTGLLFRKTDDFVSMRSLALEAGLEDGSYDSFASAYGFFDGDLLVACGGMKEQQGVFTVDCLAVKESYRGIGLGRSLVESLEKDAAKLGARRIWALARAPDFFMKIGYTSVRPDESEGPTLSGCLKCRQYQHGCNPSIVMKNL